ncbi:peptidylprolyl isomerase [Amylibacter sp. IMCC11727]|uniref:peptidylprolyl isomerase n=1 Tax=Amylibacter sp. IMCC11727 TaxID=3039851 RepID=UPI00244DE288|nr:peptidylprolyl isomerase [Amylibacter sp. IMCC11727]WGI22022.1 peptidylprolyl isomerase [Amylibacter sp. IMCC11727]
MKFTRLFASSAVAVLMATSAMAQDAVTANTVVATVNGKDITVGHVIALVDRLPQNVQQLPDDQLFNGVVDQLIQQSLLTADTSEESLAVRLAVENEVRALLASKALDKVEAAAVTDEAVEKTYQDEFGNAKGDVEYNAAHILVETEDEAKALIETLNEGTDFAELAKEKSTGPSGPNGGDLGWFGLGRMVPEFEQAVVAMNVGDVSAPVQTEFGWHVIKLNEKRELPKPTLEEVRSQIETTLQRSAVSNHLEKLTLTGDVIRPETTIDPSVIRNLDLIADE